VSVDDGVLVAALGPAAMPGLFGSARVARRPLAVPGEASAAREEGEVIGARVGVPVRGQQADGSLGVLRSEAGLDGSGSLVHIVEAPLLAHRGVDHGEGPAAEFAAHGQGEPSQPLDPVGECGVVEDVVEGVERVGLPQPPGRPQQRDLVVAEHVATAPPLDPVAHAAQQLEAVGSAVDEVAHEPELEVAPVAGLGAGEQLVELGRAALHVAYEDRLHGRSLAPRQTPENTGFHGDSPRPAPRGLRPRVSR